MAQGARPRLHISAHYQDSSSSDENGSENVFHHSHHRPSRTSLHRLSPPAVATSSSGALITTATDSSRRPSMAAGVTPCQVVPPSRRHSVAVTASASLPSAGSVEDLVWRRRLNEQIQALQISIRCLEEQNKKTLEIQQQQQQESQLQWCRSCNTEKRGDKSTESEILRHSNQLSMLAAVLATIACTGMLGYCLGTSARMK